MIENYMVTKETGIIISKGKSRKVEFARLKIDGQDYYCLCRTLLRRLPTGGLGSRIVFVPHLTSRTEFINGERVNILDKIDVRLAA